MKRRLSVTSLSDDDWSIQSKRRQVIFRAQHTAHSGGALATQADQVSWVQLFPVAADVLIFLDFTEYCYLFIEVVFNRLLVLTLTHSQVMRIAISFTSSSAVISYLIPYR